MSMFVGAGRRSGTRGGQDQFSWEDVKDDKYKDFYLGHSVHTTNKPTFNCRKPNALWYTKRVGEEVEETLADVKRREQELMNEALGLTPKRSHQYQQKLEAGDLKALTKRGETERPVIEAERISGLGHAPAPKHEGAAPLHLAEGDEDVSRREGGHLSDYYAVNPRRREAGERDEKKRLRKERKKRKKERKREKKEKKERKREKRRMKRRRRNDTSDDGNDGDEKRSRSRSPNRRHLHDSSEDAEETGRWRGGDAGREEGESKHARRSPDRARNTIRRRHDSSEDGQGRDRAEDRGGRERYRSSDRRDRRYSRERGGSRRGDSGDHKTERSRSREGSAARYQRQSRHDSEDEGSR